MLQKKIVVLMDEDWSSGISVAKALLMNDGFAVKVLTEKPEMEILSQLKQSGAEVAVVSRDGKAGLDEILRGSYGLFGMAKTGWDGNVDYEEEQRLFDAAAMAGIQHVIHVLPAFQQFNDVPVEFPYASLKNILKRFANGHALAATYIRAPFYYENFVDPSVMKGDPDGRPFIHSFLPDQKIAMAGISDLGPVVRMIFSHTVQYAGRIVGLVGDELTCREYASILTAITGYPFTFSLSTNNRCRSGIEGQPFTERLADKIESYGLHPGMQPFIRWVKRNRKLLLEKYIVPEFFTTQ